MNPVALFFLVATPIEILVRMAWDQLLVGAVSIGVLIKLIQELAPIWADRSPVVVVQIQPARNRCPLAKINPNHIQDKDFQ